MRFKSCLAAAALLWLVPMSVRSADGHIRLMFDPNQCRGDIPCGEARTLYVYAVLEGATANGITGIEYGMRFGLDGAPDPGWSFSEEFEPGITVTLGGAFWPIDEIPIMPRPNRGRGVNLAWGSCQLGTNGMILLETVQVMNTGCSGTELRLFTTDHDRPSNQAFQCPLAVLCDGPAFSKVCLMRDCGHPDFPHGDPVLCGEAVINPGANSQSPCRISAVTPSSWSVVKDLYRN